MKLYVFSFLVGLLSGLSTVFGIMYLLRGTGLYLESSYSIPVVLVSILTVFVILPRLKKLFLTKSNRVISGLISLLCVMLGFSLPFLVWAFLFQRAFSNFSF